MEKATGEVQEYIIDNDIQEALVDAFTKEKITKNIISELSTIVDASSWEMYRFMLNPKQDIVNVLDHMISMWHGVLPMSLQDSFFEEFIEKYKLIDQKIAYKNKYNVRHTIPKWFRTWFSRRWGWKYDFFESRQEFLYTGSDKNIIKDMYKHGDKEIREFLDMCHMIYVDCMISYTSYLFAYKYLVSSYAKAENKKYRNLYQRLFPHWSYPQWRISVWNYVSSEGWVKAKPHLDSSLLNSVIYQDSPWLKTKKIEGNRENAEEIIKIMEDSRWYKSVDIKNQTMILLWWRPLAIEPAIGVLPSRHMVESEKKKRISIGFDLNPKKFFKEYITKVSTEVYSEKI